MSIERFPLGECSRGKELVAGLQGALCRLGAIEALQLHENCEKAAAVRRGLLKHIDEVDIVGYTDADFSNPPSELHRLLKVLESTTAPAAKGARIAMLGTRIERSALRHYLGRVFAMGASLALRKPVYDTQCGAKFFCVTPALRSALERPFRSRWAFDVELIARLDASDPDFEIIEVRMRRGVDVEDSKLRPLAMILAGLDSRAGVDCQRSAPCTRVHVIG